MKVRKVWDAFAAHDAAALFVVHDEPTLIRQVLLGSIDAGDLPFEILVDRDRRTYRRWGLGRAPWWRIWLDPAVWLRYWRLMRAGMRLRGAGSDTLQLGGDFVVAPGGAIAYSRPQQRDDRPPVGVLAEVVADLARGGGEERPTG